MSRILPQAPSRKMSFCCWDTRQDANGGLCGAGHCWPDPTSGRSSCQTSVPGAKAPQGCSPLWLLGNSPGGDGGVRVCGSPLQDPENASGPHHLQHGQPLGTPSVPSSLPQTSMGPPRNHHPPHNHPVLAEPEGSKPYPPHQGSYRASATRKVLPVKCCSALWLPTPAVSRLQSPSLLSQPAPHGMHEPFPDHHGTSGHPETRPGPSSPQGKTEPSR